MSYTKITCVKAQCLCFEKLNEIFRERKDGEDRARQRVIEKYNWWRKWFPPCRLWIKPTNLTPDEIILILWNWWKSHRLYEENACERILNLTKHSADLDHIFISGEDLELIT